MAQFKITWARLLEIRRRQGHERWSPGYKAGIFADPKEAPSVSTASILRPAKLGGRELHTLSFNETCAALLALYNPNCWEVFDQLALSPVPREHILHGHPKATGQSLGAFKGTLDVAERLGILAKHPKVRAQIGDDPASWPWAPFPYFADLTLCLEDDAGPYVVDWPIKDKLEDFRQRGVRKSQARPDRDDPQVVARTRLQALYFSDAGIRSQEVVGRSINFQVRCNLRELFQDDSYPLPLGPAAREDLIHELVQSIGADIPAFQTARKLAARFRVEARDVTSALKQGIWRREVRVDLYQPVRMDRPLYPESRDVLVDYSDWFTRRAT